MGINNLLRFTPLSVTELVTEVIYCLIVNREKCEQFINEYFLFQN